MCHRVPSLYRLMGLGISAAVVGIGTGLVFGLFLR